MKAYNLSGNKALIYLSISVSQSVTNDSNRLQGFSHSPSLPPSLPAGGRRGGDGRPVCGDLVPVPLGGESRLPRPALLHLHLRHHDGGGGGALSRRPQHRR